MNKKRVLSICFTLLLSLMTYSNINAATHRMTWSGQQILGKASIQNFSLNNTTNLKIHNNITKAHGVPTKCNASLNLQKKGALMYSNFYTMSQTNLGTKDWNVTVEKGTYRTYFGSNPINGVTNSLDMEGYID